MAHRLKATVVIHQSTGYCSYTNMYILDRRRQRSSSKHTSNRREINLIDSLYNTALLDVSSVDESLSNANKQEKTQTSCTTPKMTLSSRIDDRVVV
jgi:hypothetical protein